MTHGRGWFFVWTREFARSVGSRRELLRFPWKSDTPEDPPETGILQHPAPVRADGRPNSEEFEGLELCGAMPSFESIDHETC